MLEYFYRSNDYSVTYNRPNNNNIHAYIAQNKSSLTRWYLKFSGHSMLILLH